MGYESYPEAFVQFMIRLANPGLFDTTTLSPQQQAVRESVENLFRLYIRRRKP